MKFWILSLAGLIGIGVSLYYLLTARRRDLVSPDWLIDNDRRVWGSGVDQPSMQWPINKIANEHAGFNTQRLRKRA